MIQKRTSTNKKPKLIAMLHVHSSNALANTKYSKLFSTETYSLKELAVIEKCRKQLLALSNRTVKTTGSEIFQYCRNACFVLYPGEVRPLEKSIKTLAFVKKIITRALSEVKIYQQNGINIVEIENVGAPYFIGNEIPLEELLILLVVAKSVRENFPKMQMGIQVLSCGELEALPIAIACNAFFVRSEASVFAGLRPEGETNNRGNLAKFYYLRNYLNAKNKIQSAEERQLPALWCDLQKKHTLFVNELSNLNTWLNTSLFQKMEGIILTGAETGSEIAEEDLKLARLKMNQIKEKITELYGNPIDFDLPLITGSGSNIEMYSKYSDYIITGTSLKKNSYWENEVVEKNVKAIVARLNT
jgi:predicted TIM-barrel enzyme